MSDEVDELNKTITKTLENYIGVYNNPNTRESVKRSIISAFADVRFKPQFEVIAHDDGDCTIEPTDLRTAFLLLGQDELALSVKGDMVLQMTREGVQYTLENSTLFMKKVPLVV